MSAATPQQRPAIPPRPSRSQDKDSMPRIPPRPIHRRIDRSLSPNPDRFAPSPLNDSPFPSKSSSHASHGAGDNGDPIARPQSVDMPSVGEEGKEYELLTENVSPERTSTVGEDLQLHAPKPSLPAQSAKQRVMTVTRTDSDKAASFGIGKPSSDGSHGPSSNRSLKKKASTASQLSAAESVIEDEQGIPEIGQQVPMYPDAGDVQAPSPGPTSGAPEGRRSGSHARKTSGLGLPPGSYGLHGHGVVGHDSLEKAYFEKHPHLLKRELTPHHHDRPNDFSMSSEDLNRIVHDTATHGPGFESNEPSGTPSEQIGWQAIEESTSHLASASPRLADVNSPLKQSTLREEAVSDDPDERHNADDGSIIHVEDPDRKIRAVSFDDDGMSPDNLAGEENVYNAPILAEDEVRKHPSPYDHQPAVEPSTTALESEERTSRPPSRPTSRPTSLYKVSSIEHQSTPLEDVEEYEPLFPDDQKSNADRSAGQVNAKAQHVHQQRFPSRDVWEDAPDSAYSTANVSTPDVAEKSTKAHAKATPPPRETETPAQAFARHQEELAEKETQPNGADSFLPLQDTYDMEKPTWTQHQAHLAEDKVRPSVTRKFPSRDVWEDAPDSLQLKTTVSTPQQELESDSPAEAKPEVPQRPARRPTDPSSSSERPVVPQRPKPKQTQSEEDVISPPSATSSTSKPAPPGRPKPQIPARPTKTSPTSGGAESKEAAPVPKQKPAVPARPTGGKIAALQAGFMSDLNKKLGLGPPAPKKEEPPAATEESLGEKKDKVPLSDARKGRARGPQRRAPAKSSSPAAAPKAEEVQKAALAIALPATVYEIDPEVGDVSMGYEVPVAANAAVSDAPEPEKGGPEVKYEKVREDEVAAKDEEAGNDDELGEQAEKREKEEKQEKQEKQEKHEESPSSDASPQREDEAPAESPEEEEEEKESPAGNTKTLATNMAGEPVVDETLKVDEKHEEIEPAKVDEH